MKRQTVTSFFIPNLWSILAITLFFTSTIAARSNGWPAASPAAPTTTISYQGTLTDAAGQPLTAATAMTFRLYAAPAGGSPLWSEARSGANAVPVASGLFSVLLGSVTPIDVGLLGQDLWLGVSVGGDPEMTPREKLGTVPFAAVAGTVPDGSITSSKQSIKTFQAADPTVVRLQGAVSGRLLSEFTFSNVPQGDVSVYATVVGRLESGSSAGWLVMKFNGQDLDVRPTHTFQQEFSQISLIGTISNFAGGTLTLQLWVSTENTNADVLYGISGDPRFQRKITLIAGQ
jgi:hypothetical protein